LANIIEKEDRVKAALCRGGIAYLHIHGYCLNSVTFLYFGYHSLLVIHVLIFIRKYKIYVLKYASKS